MQNGPLRLLTTSHIIICWVHKNGNPQSYNITSNITLTPPTTRTGYTFAGWFDAEVAGNQVTNITAGTTGNLNLYARWTANTYTITFNTNGGTAIDPLTVTYNQSI